MRNLRNIGHSAWKSPSEFEGRVISAVAWDVATDSRICAYGPSEEDALIDLVRVKNGTRSENSIPMYLLL